MVVGSLVRPGVVAMNRKMGADPAIARGDGNYGVSRGWFAIGSMIIRDSI